MAGVTDRPFRQLCKKLGAGMAISEMVASNERLRELNDRLEELVSSRTEDLRFSQDVLEALPMAVLGVSRDVELVLSNAWARRSFPELEEVPPGEDLATAVSKDLADSVGRCLAGGRNGNLLDGTRSPGKATSRMGHGNGVRSTG